MKSLIDKTSDKLVNAFLKNKIISPIPSKFTKNLKEAQKLRLLCESKIKQGDVIGTVGSTGRATGAHLDVRLNWFQIRLDPATVLNIKN